MGNHATGDVESYSEAGYFWDEARQRWVGPPGAPAGKKGLPVVGANRYWEHPTADVLTLSYRLPDWPAGFVMRWRPGDPLPTPLIEWLEAGGEIEFHNAMFERLAFHHVLTPRYGFPALRPDRIRCSMATARVNSYPGGLEKLAQAIGSPILKDPEGKRLMTKFSMPRNPTKADPRRRILPSDEPAEFERYQQYCDTDVLSECSASDRMEPMTPAELRFWLLDQEINWRGIAIDRAAVRDCIAVLNQALEKYGALCRGLTGGLEPSQVQKLVGWLSAKGVYMHSLDSDAVEQALARDDLSQDARAVLECRAAVGSASVKKLIAIENQCSDDNRLRNLIVHHGARTGRPTGSGPQPLNLPKAGPKLSTCYACARPALPTHNACPWCGALPHPVQRLAWKPEMADHVLEIMASRSLELVEWFFGDALLAISGCVRGMFVAGEGMDLIASDYSAIEAVVAACMTGEQWRIDTFNAKRDIYLESAAKITGRTYEFYTEYAALHGEHHPDRQNIGKVAELALGYGGWIGAWRAFDPDEANKTDDDIKRIILAWRAASPAIVESWGGQGDWKFGQFVSRLYGVEGAVIQAIQNPGRVFECIGCQFFMRGTMLKIRLLSGRELTYHHPSLRPSEKRPGTLAISYWTENSNPKYGMVGWVCMDTWGSRVFENIDQAVAHDIQRFGIEAAWAAGYHMVLGVYDEDVFEVPAGWGSVEEAERIMATMPSYATTWPIRASGGWRGRRYRKG